MKIIFCLLLLIPLPLSAAGTDKPLVIHGFTRGDVISANVWHDGNLSPSRP